MLFVKVSLLEYTIPNTSCFIFPHRIEKKKIKIGGIKFLHSFNLKLNYSLRIF